jgi:hypothetical protein
MLPSQDINMMFQSSISARLLYVVSYALSSLPKELAEAEAATMVVAVVEKPVKTRLRASPLYPYWSYHWKRIHDCLLLFFV